MQTQITCSSCGIDLMVEQSAAGGVFACPSCGTHFQVAPAQSAPAAPEPMVRKPTLMVPSGNAAPAPAPSLTRPGFPTHNPAPFVAKSSDKTIPIMIGSIVALCIVCVTFVVINSKKTEQPQTAQVQQPPAKQTQADIRKGIEEKAQELLDASAPAIERNLERAKAEQQELDEEQEEERMALAEMYGEKFFDGNEEAGYQLVRELEKLFDVMPDSEDEAKELLKEGMTKNPILKPFVAKIDEFPFFESNQKGPMAYLKQYKSFGTGFFVAADGWIVSNRHVVGDANEVDVRMSDGTTHRAKVMKRDDTFDLALIKVEAKAPQCLPISKGAKEMGLGRSVFTIGFPNPTLQGIEPKYTDGKVSATAGLGDDKNFYQVSVPVQPGNSGGALVDADTGWVVGVMTLRLENTADGRSAQNVSYAIKSSALHGFVEGYSKSASKSIAIVTSKPTAPDGIIESAKNSAVQILVPRDESKPTK